MSQDKPKPCPVCGETDPMPAWFCTARAMGAALKGQPCSYSVEGKERSAARWAAKMPAVRP
jgi:hypothetical protein